ncbi:MAG: DUF427 domain-containing protein [Gammaproteobacteria bacterium]|nr:DUF427 domain-containing protein [Gammaproteobacteria bacterium]
MRASLGPSPGTARYPEHIVDIQTSKRVWRVLLNGRTLAKSNNVLLLNESGYEPVAYFPPQDVGIESLSPSEAQTTCPFKGRADYFAASVNGKQTDIAWVYPAVYDEVEAIAGYVAFYRDRVVVKSEEVDEK